MCFGSKPKPKPPIEKAAVPEKRQAEVAAERREQAVPEEARVTAAERTREQAAAEVARDYQHRPTTRSQGYGGAHIAGISDHGTAGG